MRDGLVGASCVGVGLLTFGCGSDSSPDKPSHPEPPLVSTSSDCSAAPGPCVDTDFEAPGHSIARDLFGDGIEWANRGQDVLAPDPSGQTPGTPRPDVMKALDGVGFTLMRYPGGTLSDLFHWKDAIGPVANRKPQQTLNVDSATNAPTQELPVFGPDEFAAFAKALGTQILLTVNVATGTPEEAAGWLSYWKSQGISPSWVEIGNELYLPGPGNSFPVMAASDYAQRFDAFVAALRAVDPNVRCGAIGTLDTSSWCYPNCTTPAPWNQVVLQAIQQKADFFSVHNSYSPGTSADDASVYQAMLGYPDFVRFDDELIENDIDLFASAQNKGIPLAKTEFASFFVPPETADPKTIQVVVGQNQNWAAALYSALVIQTFVADPRVQIANHINPLHFLWQAPITVAFPDFSTYPNVYDPKPVVSAYGLVFEAYRELSGQQATNPNLKASPTIDTPAVGLAPARNDVPVLDAVAAKGVDADAAARGWLFVANRSLTDDLDVSIVLKNIPEEASTLEAQMLGASDYHAKNLPDAEPLVTWTPVVSGKLPKDAGSFGMSLKVPKHSLLRVRVR